MFNFNEPTLTTRGEHSIMDSLTDQNGSVFMKADKTRPLKIDQLNLKFLKFWNKNPKKTSIYLKIFC
jgi:hypothetical protein